MVPKGDKNGAKHNPKIRAEIDDERRNSLGLSLGRFGLVWVSISVSIIVKQPWFLLGFVNIVFCLKRYSFEIPLDAFGIDFGAQMEVK